MPFAQSSRKFKCLNYKAALAGVFPPLLRLPQNSPGEMVKRALDALESGFDEVLAD
jgi:hypothetical protein